mgnify:CR=1 FL=1
MFSLRSIVMIFSVLAAVAAAVTVNAADFPAKPIRVVVPWPAGGSTDTLARIVGQRLTTLVGQPIVIDNRGGASGTIGVDMVARSIPDGYTITIVEAAHVVLPATDMFEREDLNIVNIGTSAQPFAQYTPAVVEPTGAMSHATGGRPAALYRFRRDVQHERPSPGLRFSARA